MQLKNGDKNQVYISLKFWAWLKEPRQLNIDQIIVRLMIEIQFIISSKALGSISATHLSLVYIPLRETRAPFSNSGW